MKIAIIGSRECSNIDFAGNLEAVLNVSKDDTIISGGAKGIDTLAANYAKEKNINLIEILPDYKKNGRLISLTLQKKNLRKTKREKVRRVIKRQKRVYAIWQKI